MIKPFAVLMLVSFCVNAQTQPVVPPTQPFGKIDKADLEMKACDFEKDANAEVLFNVGKTYWEGNLKSIISEIHKRIKIFNDNGKREADIHIKYHGGSHVENITGIEAETINLTDGKIEVIKLDKKQIHNNIIDNELSEITFAMPNVQPGCVIEYKYKWTANYNASIPYWIFQETIPVRYSEIKTAIPDIFYFRPITHVSLPFVKHTTSTEATVLKIATHTVSMSNTTSSNQETETYPYTVDNETRALANVPSLRVDSYISSFNDNMQYLGMQLISVKPIGGFNSERSDTWAKVSSTLVNDGDFGGQLNRSLNGEDDIISHAKLLKSDDDKISFIFNKVRDSMRWNGVDRWYTNEGTYRAWVNKTGNSSEINLVLYHLLKQTGLKAYPMVVSTRENGKVDPYYTSLVQFNRTVVYIPVDSTKNYVLDATGKYNQYNETPAELLNSMGLCVDRSKNTYETVFLKKNFPVRQVVLINAEIKAGGKLQGVAQVNSTSYDRINAIKFYKREGEKKYIDSIRDGDNNLKISSIRFENMQVDSLPLTQNIAFELNLSSSDENYIYLKPFMFTLLKANPFVSESRLSDVYFAYLRNHSVNAVYKIPPGYKVDALPQSVSLLMPDKSISLKRMIAAQDGEIIVHYIIDYKKVSFNVEEYPNIHDFYKKMYEMLNEQIVLKKI